MARPINANADATRNRIIDAASKQFSQEGQAGATMRQIARAAKVSLATVHHYYGSKEALYDACIDAMYNEMAALRVELQLVLQPETNLDRVMEETIRRAHAFIREHLAAARLMMRTVVDTGEIDRRRRDEVVLPFLDQGSQLLSGLLGRPAREVRLALLTINFAVVRFSLSTAGELRQLLDLPATTSDREVIQRVDQHLVSVARTLFGIRPAAPGA
jgi:AcrR family transcriptional regulator